MLYRKDKIVSLCKDKSVLHLGFVHHSDQYKNLIKSGKWLHEKINNVSSRLVGFDYLKTEVEHLKNSYGYECYYADVTRLEEVDIVEQFDIIICGELIEHLENPGLMLAGIKKFMHKNSLFVITTPNPWSKNRLRLISKGIDEAKWLNPEHTCWFSFQTLKQLLDRYDYNEDFYGYYNGETADEHKNKFKNPALNFLKRIKDSFIKVPLINSNGLFFIAKLKNNS